MPGIDIEFKHSGAFDQIVGIIAHAMGVHSETEGCTFNRTADEIGEEVFAFLVAKVEDAEKDCRLHSAVGFVR
jgi:hypothetical protein